VNKRTKEQDKFAFEKNVNKNSFHTCSGKKGGKLKARWAIKMFLQEGSGLRRGLPAGFQPAG